MKKYVYIVIHDVVSRVMGFATSIIGLIVRWINISLVIKFSFKVVMGMGNPVTLSLTIK